MIAFVRRTVWSLYTSLMSNLLYAFIMTINRTLNIQFTNPARFRALRHDRVKPIFAVWHQATYPLLYTYRNRQCAAFTSDGRKGEILTKCAKKLGYQSIQVPYVTNAREGAKAYRDMLTLLKTARDAACVVDGPAGPIYQIKPGIFHLAARTGRVIVPLSLRFEKKIRLLWRWDRYIVPLPWSRVWITIGAPMAVAMDQMKSQLPELVADLTARLHGQGGIPHE